MQKYKFTDWITATAENCSLEINNNDPLNPILTVSGIKTDGSSKINFKSKQDEYAFADENWFHFEKALKNVYFNNCVHIRPTGAPHTMSSSISFKQAPSSQNTGNASSPISTSFDIVNENGNADDPTLKIVW